MEAVLVVLLCSQKMDTVTQVQFLNEAVFKTNKAYTLGKGMDPTILFPALVKQ